MNDLESFDKMLSGLVNKDRAETYGHPSEHFEISGMLKRIYRDAYPTMPPARLHAVEMIIDKLVRIGKTPTHLDSWIDIAGYARCAVMLDEASMARPRSNQEIFEQTLGMNKGANRD